MACRQDAGTYFSLTATARRRERKFGNHYMSESFAQLLEESLVNQQIKPGAILKGTIVDVNSDVVIVNAGLKS